MTPTSDSSVRLAADGTSAEISLVGAEPLAWTVGGRELLWTGDAAHWGFRAPILFPTVGASRNATVTVAGQPYPMSQHGFARRLPFELVEQAPASARFRLADTDETRTFYPFAFALDVTATVAAASLRLDFAIENTGQVQMPYGIGFHPAFLWPFMGGGDRAGHRVVFAEAESHDLPVVGPGGVLQHGTRRVELQGRVLPLSPELFSEALVFLNAKSRNFRFEAPSGAAIRMSVEGFPHLAVWSKPTAPFLSLEAWSAHADWEDADGDLMTRDSMIVLPPGAIGRHTVTLSFEPIETPAGR